MCLKFYNSLDKSIIINYFLACSFVLLSLEELITWK